jgi:restriction system protein
MTKQLFDSRGGYRKLHSFTFATMIHLETISFCKRFIPWQEDQLGKTAGQMIGAARSGRQNIIEGSERASTSKETEIKLTDVAKASLAELLGDYEIFLAERAIIPWSRKDSNSVAFSKLMLTEYQCSDDPLHDYWVYYHEVRKAFARWFDNEDSTVVANVMLILLKRTMGMLTNQIKSQGENFLKEGGFKERMYKCRSEERDSQNEDSSVPKCPLCGKPMRKRFPRNGSEKSKPFWGCSGFPQCKGILNME